MKNSIIFLSTTMFLLSQNCAAWESDDGQHSTSPALNLSSDYVWRGYSQTDNDPAISGNFDYNHSSGLYIGTWASNVDFLINDDPAHIEIDVYAGYAGDLGTTGITYNLGLLRYIYPGTDGGDWNEVYGRLNYRYLSFGIAHSADVYGTSEAGTYYNAAIEYPLFSGINLELGVGYYDYDNAVFGLDNPNSATDYRVGLSKALAGFGFDLMYTDTDNDGQKLYGKSVSDNRFVFSISKSL